MNWEELFNDNNIVFHCGTEEVSKKLLSLAESFGYKWASGDSFSTLDYWYLNDKNTCYNICDGVFYSLFFCKSYKIIKVNDSMFGIKPLIKFKRK